MSLGHYVCMPYATVVVLEHYSAPDTRRADALHTLRGLRHTVNHTVCGLFTGHRGATATTDQTERGGRHRSSVFSRRSLSTHKPHPVWRYPHESCAGNIALSASQHGKNGSSWRIHFAARFWRLGGIWGHSTTVSILRDGCQRRPQTHDRRWRRQTKRLFLAHEMQTTKNGVRANSAAGSRKG